MTSSEQPASRFAQYREAFLAFNREERLIPRRPNEDLDFTKPNAENETYNRALLSAAIEIFRQNNPKEAERYIAAYEEFYGGVDAQGKRTGAAKLDVNKNGKLDSDDQYVVPQKEFGQYSEALMTRAALERIVARLEKGDQSVSSEEATAQPKDTPQSLRQILPSRDTNLTYPHQYPFIPLNLKMGDQKEVGGKAPAPLGLDRLSNEIGITKAPANLPLVADPSPGSAEDLTYTKELYRYYKRLIKAYYDGDVGRPEEPTDRYAREIFYRALVSASQELVDERNGLDARVRNSYRTSYARYYGAVDDETGELVSYDRQGNKRLGFATRKLDTNRDGRVDEKDRFIVAKEDVPSLEEAATYQRAVAEVMEDFKDRIKFKEEENQKIGKLTLRKTREDFKKRFSETQLFSSDIKKSYTEGGFKFVPKENRIASIFYTRVSEEDTALSAIDLQTLQKFQQEILLLSPRERAFQETLRDEPGNRDAVRTILQSLEEKGWREEALQRELLRLKKSTANSDQQNRYTLALFVVIREEQITKERDGRPSKMLPLLWKPGDSALEISDRITDWRTNVAQKRVTELETTVYSGPTTKPAAATFATAEPTKISEIDLAWNEVGEPIALNMGTGRKRFTTNVRALVKTADEELASKDLDINPLTDQRYWDQFRRLINERYGKVNAPGVSRADQAAIDNEYATAIAVLYRMRHLRAQAYAETHGVTLEVDPDRELDFKTDFNISDPVQKYNMADRYRLAVTKKVDGLLRTGDYLRPAQTVVPRYAALAELNVDSLTYQERFTNPKLKQVSDEVVTVTGVSLVLPDTSQRKSGTLQKVITQDGKVRYEFRYGLWSKLYVPKEFFDRVVEEVRDITKPEPTSDVATTPAAPASSPQGSDSFDFSKSKLITLEADGDGKITALSHVTVVMNGKTMTNASIHWEIINGKRVYSVTESGKALGGDVGIQLTLAQTRAMREALQRQQPATAAALQRQELEESVRDVIVDDKSRFKTTDRLENIQATVGGEKRRGTLLAVRSEGIITRYEFAYHDWGVRKAVPVSKEVFEAQRSQLEMGSQQQATPASVGTESSSQKVSTGAETPVAATTAPVQPATSPKTPEKAHVSASNPGAAKTTTTPSVPPASQETKPQPVLIDRYVDNARVADQEHDGKNMTTVAVKNVTLTFKEGDQKITKTGTLRKKGEGEQARYVFSYGKMLGLGGTEITLTKADGEKIFEEAKTIADNQKQAAEAEKKAKKEKSKSAGSKASPAPTAPAVPVTATAAQPPSMRAREDDALLDYVLGKESGQRGLMWYQMQTLSADKRALFEPLIRDLQEGLQRSDTYKTPPEPNGKFGRKTEDAVKALQRAYALQQDGVVGIRTITALQVEEALQLVSECKKDNKFSAEERTEIKKELDDIARAAAVMGGKLPEGIRAKIDVLLSALESAKVTEADQVLQQQITALRALSTPNRQ